MEIKFPRPSIEKVRVERGLERSPGKSSLKRGAQTRHNSPFEQRPHVGMGIQDVGADHQHGRQNKAVRVAENLGNQVSRSQRNPDLGKTGMETTEGIP